MVNLRVQNWRATTLPTVLDWTDLEAAHTFISFFGIIIILKRANNNNNSIFLLANTHGYCFTGGPKQEWSYICFLSQYPPLLTSKGPLLLYFCISAMGSSQSIFTKYWTYSINSYRNKLDFFTTILSISKWHIIRKSYL